jgi:all-trans-retinol 13,14-reductase
MTLSRAPATFAESHPLKGERFWSRTSPAGPWDAIVVGSGMGGLTTAAVLAELGQRVLVLEQHYIPGGFTHAFSHKGWVWDVGVHVIGEVTPHTSSGRLLARLTRGRLAWEPLGPVYEDFHFPDGFRIQFPSAPEAFREALAAAFPREGPAIDAYLKLVGRAARAIRGQLVGAALPWWAARPLVEPLLRRSARPWVGRTVEEVLATLTDDKRLQAVLTAQWGYYGTPPSHAAFAVQAMVTKHFLHGGYYPVGGAQEIARWLCAAVAEAGGWTRIAAPVEDVVVADGRAVGVRLADGEEIRARRVVVATGIGTAVRRLVPEPYRSQPWAQAVRELAAGPAHLCLYLGLEGDPRQAGASGASHWFYRTWDAEAGLWDVTPAGDLPPAPVLYTSFPSLKDAAHDPGPEQRHTVEVVTFVPWSAFAPWSGSRWNHRGAGYDSFKERLRQAMLDQFLAEMPGLAPMVRYSELSTPLSTDHFCRPLAGSIYGLEATPRRFAEKGLRCRSPIPGLYFSGSDVTSGGVMGAFGGGLLAALAIEPWAVGKLLRGR